MSTIDRRDRFRDLLRHRELDAALITDPRNVRYLTGFTGSNGALLIHTAGDAKSALCTDGRYTIQAAKQVPDLPVVIERACDVRLTKNAIEAGVHRLGFESHVLTVDSHRALTTIAGDDRLVSASRLVEELRLVKDGTEIDILRRACAAADTALAGLLESGGLRPGRTEREVARELESRMQDAGAQGPSFETIVAAGPNSAVPHHRPTDAVLAAGDFVKMDFGALLDGYHSDMTRTVVLGRAADWQRELYELVARAQTAGRNAVAPGAGNRDVDGAARSVIVDAGHGADFPHGLGHGIGLAIHEAPALSQLGVGTLAAGMTVTVEPGVYLAGRGGVRIEDSLVVRDGEPELLTLTTKDLLEV